MLKKSLSVVMLEKSLSMIDDILMNFEDVDQHS